MASPEDPSPEDRWNGFKPIGDERGDNRPSSWFASLRSKIAILIGLVVINLIVVGALMFRIFARSTGIHLSQNAMRFWGRFALIVVILSVVQWAGLCLYESRTRKENRRSRPR